MTEDEGACFVCRQNAAVDRLPLRERILLTEHWRVAHAFDTSLPGWLVVGARVFPRMPDLPAASIGPQVFRHLGVAPADRVDASARDDIAASLAAWLSWREG